MSKPETPPFVDSSDETSDDAGRRPRRIGRIIGRSIFGVIAGLVVIALVAAGFLAWTVQRSFPTLDGEVEVEGLRGTVDVLRNNLGEPTIVAANTDDLFYAQGYVHAQDRFWEMDFRRHVTSGRLSELFGESQLETDKFLRTLGWHEIAEREVRMLEPDVRGYYEAYADGVNAYLTDHHGAELSLEYAVLGLQNADYEVEPWTAADSVAWLKAMAWDLRENIDSETDRALLAQNYDADEIAKLYPGYPFDRNPVIVPEMPAIAAPAGTRAENGAEAEAGAVTAGIQWREVDGVIEAAAALLGGAGEGIGSNSWVVSGDLTESGLPLLSNDPHLGASLPAVWHQVGLKCRVVNTECPFDVAGFGFAGVPGVIIGHNAKVAWGFTNLTTDVTDLYIEKVEGDRYWRDGELVPLDITHEIIKVAGGDSVELEIRSTAHGPILSGLTEAFDEIAADPYVGGTASGEIAPPADAPEGEYAVSLQWTALQPGTTASSIFALNVAQSFDDFRAAAAQFNVPAQNLIYADTDGNIGYQTPGTLPIRGAGDGSLPQPGWDSAYDWTGTIPFDDLPTLYNPPQGYIVTANNAIVDESYPYFLTNDWDYGWRAARIVDLLERKIASGKLVASDMREIQADNEFWMGMRLVTALADVQIDDPDAAAAVELLRSWNAQNDADSAAAAYANVYWNTLVEQLFASGDEPMPVWGQGRLFLVVNTLLDEPMSPFWDDEERGIRGRDAMLADVAERAYDELVTLQGDNTARWNWGSLHALTLRSDTFGSSGIAPIEWLFNRGPFPVGGGSSVVNATGWGIGESYETVTVPSMRMIIDLSDFDRSQWNFLTGNSGHAFHPNYFDQTEAWQQVRLTRWAFSLPAVRAAATNTLTLTPAD